MTLVLPAGFKFHAWSHRLLNAHAEAKYRSFRNELDANVFPVWATRKVACG